MPPGEIYALAARRRGIVRPAQRVVDLRDQQGRLIVLRPRRHGLLVELRGSCELPQREALPRVEVVRFEQPGIDLKGRFEGRFSLLVVSVERKREAARGLRLRTAAVQLHRLRAGPFRLLAKRFGAVRIEIQVRPAVGQPGICLGRLRIDFHRPQKQLQGPFHRLGAELIVVGAAAAVALFGLEAGGRHRRERPAKSFGHALRDLVLDGEDLAQLAIVLFRPELKAGLRLGEAHRDAQPVAGFPHAAFEQAADSQPLADFRNPEPARSVKRRGPRDHAQSRNPAERVDHLFGHPVAEILLVLLGAQVGEGQHCDREALPRLQFHAPLGPPRVQFGLVRVHRPQLVVAQAVHGKALFALPTLHRACAALEVGGNLLPGIETIRRTNHPLSILTRAGPKGIEFELP